MTIHEDDPYLHGTIKGSLQFHPKFLDFGINTGKSWQPEKLGLFIKMNRAFFIDKATNMQLVTTFLNFKASVNAQVERDVKMNGSRTDNYGQVVNSNMPESFTLVIPIFKGKPAENWKSKRLRTLMAVMWKSFFCHLVRNTPLKPSVMP